MRKENFDLRDLLCNQKENEKIALKSGNKQLSYCEWYKRSKYVSEMVLKEGRDVTQNVAIFLPNSIEYAVSYFGILFSKKTIIPIFIQSSETEIKSVVDYCSVNYIITSTEHKQKVINALEENNFCFTVYCIDTDEVIRVEKKEKMQEAKKGSDVAIMLHTSGTTSDPKRVMLTHENLINNVRSNIESLGLTESDKVLIWIPMMFGYCNTAQFLTHLYLGASMVIMNEVFMPKRFFEIVERERITNFTCVPTNLIIILNYRHYEKYDVSSLRYICFGGGKMPEEQLGIILERFPQVGFVQTYGQTEASPRVTALLPKDSIRKLGSVGRPIPNVKVRVVDETEKDVDVGMIGEIIVQGKNVMKGYYLRDEITRNTIKNNWLYTGDLGYFDEEGYLYLAGRKKNMIISGGLNIYPEEIEEIISGYENIKDVYVYGVDDVALGESVEAKVVLFNPEVGIDENQLKKFCAEHLSQYKIPKKFQVVEQLDKTYNGKIKRGKDANTRNCVTETTETKE